MRESHCEASETVFCITGYVIVTSLQEHTEWLFKDVESEAYTIALQTPPTRQASDTELLLKLDDYSQPGLYDAEFRALLKRMVKCSCGMIMMHRVYKDHRCAKALFQPIKRQRINDSNASQSQGDVGESQGDNGASDEEDSQEYSGDEGGNVH